MVVGVAVGLTVGKQLNLLSGLVTKPSRHAHVESLAPATHMVVARSQLCAPSAHGARVGKCVGSDVGDPVGATTGAAVGLFVGAFVAAVGDVEGAGVML